MPFKIERPVAKPKSTKSLEARRLERLQRAQEMFVVMEGQGLGYRQVGALFGVSGPMAFKLVKELHESGEQQREGGELATNADI